jgi:hypothetical protein
LIEERREIVAGGKCRGRHKSRVFRIFSRPAAPSHCGRLQSADLVKCTAPTGPSRSGVRAPVARKKARAGAGWAGSPYALAEGRATAGTN